MPLVTAAEMRSAEAAAIAAGTSARTLMERAAQGAARHIIAHHGACPVTILAGPGNNGGDGWGVALHLADAGFAVTVAGDGRPQGEPAATMAARWTGPVVPLAEAPPAPLIVDALFGTGLARPLPDAVQAVLDRLRGHGTVIALDIPSGLCSDTGATLGRPLAAARTISFGAAKRGHVLGAGLALCGALAVIDIGVPVVAAASLVQPPRLAGLAHDAHKYARGHVLVIEGAAQRGGAAGLAALAALRAGAGLVTLVGEGGPPPALALMRRSDGEGRALLADPRTRAVVIGPGLPDDRRGRDWLALLLAGSVPVVADAGALALLGALPARQQVGAPLLLTPHEGEFTRLFGPIGADRIAAVQAAAASSGAVVLLKGPATIIAAPDGRVAVNAHATPWLATAGSGDVLAGIIGALVGQGMALFDAACVGVWLHGDAGRRGGPGLIADDLPGQLPAVLAAL